ncbi:MULTISPECIES: tripartite tricarboxylate transporter TctB family protein [Mesorhizobium]|uniref:Tripartite tricarboxylate transporter TctB family protein n=1 Tax=Mesorhizobium denitrificans TaxID=2294114 RepID=A0A371XJJ2_9HYPH|nr:MULTISPECIES: tripartite tricarboxylate transporter TctB family protein [Mesorhizobium]RFC69379.1 tripartite tricarboxylate transporter TctB family protein [Mesorhizobium denitrificans]
MNKDTISGIVLLVFDAAYFWSAQQIPHSVLDDAFGARGLPNILSVILGFLALVIIARGLMAARIQRADAAVDDDEPVDHESTLPRAIGFVLIGVGYIVLLPILGYPVAITLMIATIALYEGAARDWRIPVAAVFGGVLFWLIFDVLLGVGQPSGMIF